MASLFCDFLGYFEKYCFRLKTVDANFWDNFYKHLHYLLFPHLATLVIIRPFITVLTLDSVYS